MMVVVQQQRLRLLPGLLLRGSSASRPQLVALLVVAGGGARLRLARALVHVPLALGLLRLGGQIVILSSSRLWPVQGHIRLLLAHFLLLGDQTGAVHGAKEHAR